MMSNRLLIIDCKGERLKSLAEKLRGQGKEVRSSLFKESIYDAHFGIDTASAMLFRTDTFDMFFVHGLRRLFDIYPHLMVAFNSDTNPSTERLSSLDLGQLNLVSPPFRIRDIVTQIADLKPQYMLLLNDNRQAHSKAS